MCRWPAKSARRFGRNQISDRLPLVSCGLLLDKLTVSVFVSDRDGGSRPSHVRSEGDVDPLSAAQGYGEVLSFAAATGANVHICHLNSTSFRDMPLAASMIHRALEEGLNITVEAYPYGAASTAIGAKFLDPENLSRIGMTYENVEYQGKRLNESSFTDLRAKNPGAITVVHFYELPRDQKLLHLAVLFPDGIIASDAMPWLSTKTGKEVDPNAWIPDDAYSHPRSAGTFTRFLSQ